MPCWMTAVRVSALCRCFRRFVESTADAVMDSVATKRAKMAINKTVRASRGCGTAEACAVTVDLHSQIQLDSVRFTQIHNLSTIQIYIIYYADLCREIEMI